MERYEQRGKGKEWTEKEWRDTDREGKERRDIDRVGMESQRVRIGGI